MKYKENISKIVILLTFILFNVSNSENENIYEFWEKIPGVSHICMYHHWLRDELRVCDMKHTSAFACVGAIEGKIQLCENSTDNELFVPICFQENTLEIITCKYKNIVSRNLCLPRKSISSIFSKSFRNYDETPHITFRVCKDKRRFSCFNKGEIKLCDQLKADGNTKYGTFNYENDCNSLTSENCRESNFNSSLSKTKNSGLRNRKLKTLQKPRQKLSNDRNKNNKLHNLLLDFHETYRSSLFNGNSRNHLSKENHNMYQNKNTPKLSTDKDKSSHKTSKRRRYQKMEHNYGKERRDKNTTASKYRNHQNNKVSSEMKTKGSNSSFLNKYFHLLKCEDCQIENVMKVENEDFKVNMWTLPGNYRHY